MVAVCLVGVWGGAGVSRSSEVDRARCALNPRCGLRFECGLRGCLAELHGDMCVCYFGAKVLE